MNWWLTLAGSFVGIVVGMTGMGGGALMTPTLVLFFGVPPLAAVSNDLVVSAVMKPVGALVHIRHGSVSRPLVQWLALGSVPCAFAGVFVSRALGPGAAVETVVKFALGVALLIAAASLVIKAYLQLAARARRRSGNDNPNRPADDINVRPVLTLVVGAVGGLIVGMTSVGSGSLIIIALMAIYPRLRASTLVGTDLVQAVPLVLSAALAHLLFGDFHPGLTAPLLVGSVPGVYLGARLSARVPGGLIRRALALVLFASALKLLDAGNVATIVSLSTVVICGPPLWMWARKRHGMPALAHARRQSA